MRVARATYLLITAIVAAAASADSNLEDSITQTTHNADVDVASENQARLSPDASGQSIATAASSALDELHSIEHHGSSTRHKPSKFLGFIQALLRRSKDLDENSNHGSQSRGTAHISSGSALVPVPDELARPVATLKEACEEDNPDALFLMADMSFHGNFTYPRSFDDALFYYDRLATIDGNATAHSQLAFLYSTGLTRHGADQALAMLHHGLAASQGSMRSQMALGYRHLNGIGTSPNCTQACGYYAQAAAQALRWMRSGPPGGLYWSKRGYHFDEDFGGLYGATPSLPLHGAVVIDSEDMDDVLDYLTYLAEKGETSACFQLAKIYNEGSRTVAVDPVKSLYWFRQVAKSYWTKDGKTVKNAKAMRYHAKTAAYIGTAYLRGDGVNQDFDKAKMWFGRGIGLGDPTAQNGLGLMHLNGLGPASKSIVKAEELFRAAADQDHKSAQLNLAKLHAARGDVLLATRLFESAARAGRVEAFYYLAQFSQHGVGREPNCNVATSYYKLVAEAAESLHSTILYGNEAYRRGDIDDALMSMMIAAESGYEVGQVNVAFLLDKHRTRLGLRERYVTGVDRVRKALGLGPRMRGASGAWQLDRNSALPQNLQDMSDELALLHYTRAAAQSNFEALAKAGDYYLEGLGTPVPSPDKAVSLWTSASDSRAVPLALWNLGWAYENGVGVEQDYHLAKRYYDACLEQEPRAYLPVTLSLLKLRARSAYNTIVGGKVNSIRSEAEDDDGNVGARRNAPFTITWQSLRQGLKHFWKSQWEHIQDEEDTGVDAGIRGSSSRGGKSSGPSSTNYIDDDYPDSENDLFESLVILAICLTVGILLFLRANRTGAAGRAGNRAPDAHRAPGQFDNDPPDVHIAQWIGGAAI
ncbi:ERAD-associated protein [Savitreella phatthalungensis]